MWYAPLIVILPIVIIAQACSLKPDAGAPYIEKHYQSMRDCGLEVSADDINNIPVNEYTIACKDPIGCVILFRRTSGRKGWLPTHHRFSRYCKTSYSPIWSR